MQNISFVHHVSDINVDFAQTYHMIHHELSPGHLRYVKHKILIKNHNCWLQDMNKDFVLSQ
jgi:hypothetical protein